MGKRIPKQKRITCKFCGKSFDYYAYVDLLRDNACCRDCYIKLGEKDPGLYGKALIDKAEKNDLKG